MSDPSPAPLLELNALRVDVAGAPMCEGLSGSFDGKKVVLVGEGAAAIASAVTMAGHVAGGSLRIDGADVGSREHVGKVGIAPADIPLPPRMTVQDYVALSLRLGGVPSGDAKHAATVALADAGIGGLSQRMTESLAPPERRVVLIAQALQPGVKAVFVETPVSGLEGPAAKYVLDVLERVSATRRWLATAQNGDAASHERDLLMVAEHVGIVSRSALVWEGAPGALMDVGTVYVVTVRGEAEAFCREASTRGFVLQGDPPRFSLTIPTGLSPSDVLDTALKCDAVVVEMAPVVGKA